MLNAPHTFTDQRINSGPEMLRRLLYVLHGGLFFGVIVVIGHTILNPVPQNWLLSFGAMALAGGARYLGLRYLGFRDLDDRVGYEEDTIVELPGPPREQVNVNELARTFRQPDLEAWDRHAARQKLQRVFRLHPDLYERFRFELGPAFVLAGEPPEERRQAANGTRTD